MGRLVIEYSNSEILHSKENDKLPFFFLQIDVIVQSLSCVRLFCDPVDCSPPGSSVLVISQQENWSGLPFPSPGDLSNLGIKACISCIACGFVTTEPPGKSLMVVTDC